MYYLKTIALSLLLACAAPLAFADDPPDPSGEPVGGAPEGPAGESGATNAPPVAVDNTPVQRLNPVDVTSSPTAPSSPVAPVSTPQTSEDVSRTARPGAGVSIADVSVPVSAYSGRRLERRVRGTLGEVLGQEPGVTMTAFGAGASRPIIRGLGGERVRILEGGFGSSDVSSISEDHATTVVPHLVRSIEVLRGPAVLRYGPLAIGGVTNAEDGRIPEAPIGAPLHGMVEAWYGTADDEVGGVLRVEGQHGSWNWHISGVARATDDTDIPGFARSAEERTEEPVDDPSEEPHGTVPNSNTWTQGVNAGVSRIGPWGFFGISAQWYRTEYGVPGEAHHHEEDGHDDDDHDDDDHKPTVGATRALNFDGVDSEGVDIEMERIRIEAKGRACHVPSCFTQIDYGVAFTTYEHTEFEEGDTGTVFESDTIEARVEAGHRSIGGWLGAIGLQVEYNELAAFGDEAFIPPSDTLRLGTYVFESRRLAPRWHVDLAGRVDFVSIDSPAGNEEFLGVSASGGIKHDLTRQTSASASLSYTERAPTPTELFADGAHIAAQQFEIGSATLDKERAVGAELGLRHQGDRFAVAANAYYTRYPRLHRACTHRRRHGRAPGLRIPTGRSRSRRPRGRDVGPPMDPVPLRASSGRCGLGRVRGLGAGDEPGRGCTAGADATVAHRVQPDVHLGPVGRGGTGPVHRRTGPHGAERECHGRLRHARRRHQPPLRNAGWTTRRDGLRPWDESARRRSARTQLATQEPRPATRAIVPAGNAIRFLRVPR